MVKSEMKGFINSKININIEVIDSVNEYWWWWWWWWFDRDWYRFGLIRL